MNKRSTSPAVPDMTAPLPRRPNYERCRCGYCRKCRENEKWDRMFAKFEVKEDGWDTNGLFQSTLSSW